MCGTFTWHNTIWRNLSEKRMKIRTFSFSGVFWHGTSWYGDEWTTHTSMWCVKLWQIHIFHSFAVRVCVRVCALAAFNDDQFKWFSRKVFELFSPTCLFWRCKQNILFASHTHTRTHVRIARNKRQCWKMKLIYHGWLLKWTSTDFSWQFNFRFNFENGN